LKFKGMLILEFSKPLTEEHNGLIRHVVDELNNNILVKGATLPEEAAKVVDFRIEDGKLVLNLETGRQVRIHSAAMRIKNYVAKIFGSKLKVGVRGLTLKDTVIELDGEFSVSPKIPLIRKLLVDEGKTYVYLDVMDESVLKKPVLDRLIKLLNDKEMRAKWKGKAEHWQLIKRSREKEPLFKEDPNKIFEEIGWIKRFSIGQWIYTPPAIYLINMIKQLFLEEVVKPLGFEEVVFPKIYPPEIGLKTGHLKGTINSMLFASLPISYDISAFEELIDYMSVMNEVPQEDLRDYLRPPSYFLCFAQCEPFYQFFSGEIVDDRALPIKWFDQSGPSFRWEAGGLHGVERLIEFHRIEVVWLGKPEQVVEIRNQLLERYEHFMDKVLDLEWRWAWVTPWYLEHAGVIEKISEEINRPGTIDFEAWLPYKGSRDDAKAWLEIGNISIHGTKFTDPFKIKYSKKNVKLWTGCSGFGVERWMLVFIAQKGFDPENWPSKPREYVKKNPMPKSLLTVTYPKTKEGKELLKKIVDLYSNP